MSLQATDAIDDAIDATKEFLLPFEKGTWLRLAVVVFFIGGGGGGLFQFPSNGGGGFGNGGQNGGFQLLGALPGSPELALQSGIAGALAQSGVSDLALGLSLVALIAIALVVLLLLVLTVVSSVMEFVFARSLIDQEVHVRRYFKQNLGNGLQLFIFTVGLGLLFLGIVAAMAVAVVGPSIATENPGVAFGSMLLLLPVFLILGIVYTVVRGFTMVFTVPIMLTTEENIIGSWGRLWNAMTDEPKEYLAYLGLSVALGIGVNIALTIAMVIAIIVFAIPLLIVAFVAFAALPEIAALAITGVVGVALAIAFLLVYLLIKVPLFGFLRYYAMFVLGGTEESLDPIPDIRAQVAD